ncbi:MarR family transcriptional regulator [Actinomadura logoneensis]|uniref:MarR family transcriptional regulator n=1 Tax=Actinomadura logoneensis TaxID=2293572 RepID=A0A372JR49_9ACTN|nr:MarR family winged helix-turn-helix transcriptional regulator [Actinomadura logoneensis]RFU42276.1 MarR family transcriptional regulator [Actinomadura logoneensis]
MTDQDPPAPPPASRTEKPAQPPPASPVPSGSPGGAQDAVTEVLRQWRELRPDLDTTPMAVIGRVNRCAALLQHAAGTPLGRAGLTRAEYDTLTALYRLGSGATPGRLARETFASGAAVTKRLRSLAARGLVERRADERDRRVQHVSLSEDGRALMDRLLTEQVGYETSLLDGLGPERNAELASALAELLSLLEGTLARHAG